jgi:hypothetical protein
MSELITHIIFKMNLTILEIHLMSIVGNQAINIDGIISYKKNHTIKIKIKSSRFYLIKQFTKMHRM